MQAMPSIIIDPDVLIKTLRDQKIIICIHPKSHVSDMTNIFNCIYHNTLKYVKHFLFDNQTTIMSKHHMPKFIRIILYKQIV